MELLSNKKAFDDAWRQVKIAKNWEEEVKRIGAKMGEEPLSSFGYLDDEMLDSYGVPIDDYYKIPTHLESSQSLRSFMMETAWEMIIAQAAKLNEGEVESKVEQATGMMEFDSNFSALFDSVKRELIQRLKIAKYGNYDG